MLKDAEPTIEVPVAMQLGLQQKMILQRTSGQWEYMLADCCWSSFA